MIMIYTLDDSEGFKDSTYSTELYVSVAHLPTTANIGSYFFGHFFSNMYTHNVIVGSPSTSVPLVTLVEGEPTIRRRCF
jgi:hypothetical protein